MINISKKIALYAVGLTGLALAFSGIAFAENSWTVQASTTIGIHASTTGPRAGVKGIMPEIRNNIKTSVDANASTTVARQALKSGIDARQNQMKVIQMARVVWIRINAVIIRLGKIVDKLDSRIAKIKASGGNTTIAETDSANAKISLSKARADMDDIKTIILSISSTSPVSAGATTTIKVDISDAETQVKTAQNAIEDAIKNLKTLQINAHASTTASGATQ